MGLAAAAVGMIMLGSVGVASAATHPIGISPMTDVVARAPLAVSVTFDRPLRHSGAKLRVLSAGREVAQGSVTTSARTLRRKLRLGAPHGDYKVIWKAVAADGQHLSGSFVFTAARSNTVGSTATDPQQMSGPSHPPETPIPGRSPVPTPGPTSAPASSPAVTATPSPVPVTQTAIDVPGYTLGAAVPVGRAPGPPSSGVSSGFAAVPLIVGGLLVVAAGVVSALNKRRLHA